MPYKLRGKLEPLVPFTGTFPTLGKPNVSIAFLFVESSIPSVLNSSINFFSKDL